MNLKKLGFTLILICSLSNISFSQENKQLEEILIKSFRISDSSEYFFNKAKTLLKTKKDTGDFYLFKFYRNQENRNHDSALYYANKVLRDYIHDGSNIKKQSFFDRLSGTHQDLGNYEISLEYNQKAIETAEIMKDTVLVGELYAVRGNIYHDFEDYEQGVIYGKKAVEILSSQEKLSGYYLHRATNIIAINFDDWNKLDSALYYHKKNFKYEAEISAAAFKRTYNNIGNTLLKQGNYNEAQTYILRALEINRQIKNEYGLSTNYTNLGAIAYNTNQFEKAKIYLDSALYYGKASASIEKVRDALQQQAWYFERVGEYKKALEKQIAFFDMRDSIFSLTRAQKAAVSEVQFQTAQKETALAETRATLAEKELEVRKKNNLIYGVGGGALFLGLLGYLFYNQQRLKNRQQVKEYELEKALVKIETQNRLQEQRLRISRDLHDNIGSQLTFITSSLDNLKYGMKEKEVKTKEKLTEIGAFTKTTINELRDTIWAMNKEKITFEDLEARLGNLLDQARTASSETNFDLIISPEINKNDALSSVEGMNLYRMIQEAINNAIKYAEADHITVTLSRNRTNLEAMIVDNGKGFDVKSPELGNGLTNMKKRMKDIQGEIHIASTIGEGTSITAHFPLSLNTAIDV